MPPLFPYRKIPDTTTCTSHKYTVVQVHVWTSERMYKQTHTYTRTYACTHTFQCIYTHTYTHTCAHTHTHTHTHTPVHMHSHVHLQTHTYTSIQYLCKHVRIWLYKLCNFCYICMYVCMYVRMCIYILGLYNNGNFPITIIQLSITIITIMAYIHEIHQNIINIIIGV